MLLFRDEEHAAIWRNARKAGEGSSMSLETGWQLAQSWFGDRLAPDWRRMTAAEGQSLLSNLGLVGDFWQLKTGTRDAGTV